MKSWIKNGTEVHLNLSSNLIGDSKEETNFRHILLLIDRQVSRIYRLLRQSLKTSLSSVENVLKPLAKSVLIP